LVLEEANGAASRSVVEYEHDDSLVAGFEEAEGE